MKKAIRPQAAGYQREGVGEQQLGGDASYGNRCLRHTQNISMPQLAARRVRRSEIETRVSLPS